MELLCIFDDKKNSALSDGLVEGISNLARKNGHDLDLVPLKPGDLIGCFGCLRCWTDDVESCITKDKFHELREKAVKSDIVFTIGPVIFGQFSFIPKNVLDRTIVVRMGSKWAIPKQFYIGYGEDLTDEEVNTFLDIANKHMGNADVVHPEIKGVVVEARASRSADDNRRIIESIERSIQGGGGER